MDVAAINDRRRLYGPDAVPGRHRDRLDVFLDDAEPVSFDLSSREAFVRSVESMLARNESATWSSSCAVTGC